MGWLTAQERVTLAVLGAAALAGLGILGWQQRRPPITVEVGPLLPSAEWDARLQASKIVDLNRATVEDLERLPDVGPATAKKILDYRRQHGRFRRVEDLLDVQGIGPKTLEELRDDVTVH
ncbi:MAG: helix-hairpin-helix domain-containing protein [Candidatus Omnitrophica bacterium]|nr:helix-hairpin-helix domain-containing protein [Candidatus Omnitrophota bacterium]